MYHFFDLWKPQLPSLIILNLNKCQPFIMALFNNVLQYVNFRKFFPFFPPSVWMPTLWVMELGRQLCGKMRRSSRKAQYSSSPSSTWGLEIHFYMPEVHQLEYLSGCYTVEKLCVEAAKKCCKWITCWPHLKTRE